MSSGRTIDDDAAIGRVREVSWTVTKKICIGHHKCTHCKILTPEPDSDTIREFMHREPGDQYIWPSDWVMPGWSRHVIGGINGKDEETQHYCPACTKAMLEGLAAARQKVGV
jgi:hypothetical protein